MSEQKSTSVHKAPTATQLENFVCFSKHLAKVHHSIGDGYNAFANVVPRIVASAGQIDKAETDDSILKAIQQIVDNYQIISDKIKAHQPVIVQQMYDMASALRITGLERGTLYNKAWMGALEAIKVDRRLQFPQEALTALILEQQTPSMKSIAEIGRVARKACELGIDFNQFIDSQSEEISNAA